MNASPSPILNVSAYKFVALDGLEQRRDELLRRADEAQLKGTVLLAEEGINLFLAGPATEVHGVIDWLRRDPRLADLQPKESWSDGLPFKKLLVKIKREIIRMNRPSVRPQAGRAPAVSADTLARWLDQGHDDEGRDVVMLDTRNAFEIEYGGFNDALNWHIDKFSEFPQALEQHRHELAGKTVVSYCTGGIRCEKAALLMADAGVDTVLQLDGGILKYLEQQGGKPGGRHYSGECFVFDERLAIDAELSARLDASAGADDYARARALPTAAPETP